MGRIPLRPDLGPRLCVLLALILLVASAFGPVLLTWLALGILAVASAVLIVRILQRMRQQTRGPSS